MPYLWQIYEMKESSKEGHEVHINTRKVLKNLPEVSDFEFVLSRSMLSNEDKTILRMIYLEDKNINLIADTLGFSEQTIRVRHKKALKKINKVVNKYY